MVFMGLVVAHRDLSSVAWKKVNFRAEQHS